jgi:hypothetical protein
MQHCCFGRLMCHLQCLLLLCLKQPLLLACLVAAVVPQGRCWVPPVQLLLLLLAP